MIFNNTIFGNGDVIFQIDDAGAGSCDMQLKNNIIYGAYDYHGFDATAMFYSASCSTINRDEDYNLCYGVFKTAYKDCDGANSMDNTTDPLLTGAPIPIGFSGDSTTGYYTGTDFMEEFYLSASSPARDVADESITADGADAYDVNQFDRGASWDLGGYEYGTTEGEGGSDCGNNTTEAPEVCDGTDLNGYNCTTVPGSTWDGGTLACLSNCTNYDTSACTSTPNCGNGSIDPGEDCDTSGPLLNGETCASQGYSADPADDNLACTAGTCLYDYSGCAAIACQDGYEEGSEQCDDGNATEGDGCSSACEDENANYELFRTYTETDPNSRISVEVHKSTVAAITRNESAKLQSDQGAGNIGDFVIDYTLTQDDCVDSTGGAAIAYDAGTNYTIDNSSTATFSHTVGTGSNRLLIVSIAREEFGTNRSVTGVTYNSVAMTFAASANHSNGNNKVSTYYLLAPDSGANNVEVTFSGQVGAIAVTADSYENILQQAPEVTGNTEDAAINFNTLTDGSIALNSLVGSISSATLSTTDNELHNFANTGDLVMGVSSKESNAGADSMAWSVSTGVYASTIVVFAPQGTGGDNPAITGVIGISSSAHADIKAQETAGDGIFLYLSCRSSASNNTWNLVTVDSGTSSDTYLDAFYNGTRYGQLERSGTTLTNKVYTDMARTNLLDTQTVTTTATAHRYLTITPTYNDSVTGTSFSGSVYDVDLTATGSPASPATKSFEINGVTIDGSGFP